MCFSGLGFFICAAVSLIKSQQDKSGQQHKGRPHDTLKNILRIDDAIHARRALQRNRVGAHHGIAQQDQHQGRRDHHTQCAGNADQALGGRNFDAVLQQTWINRAAQT